MVRFWLEEGAQEKIKNLMSDGARWKVDVRRDNDSGYDFFEIGTNPLDVTFSVPDIPAEMIRAVTLRGNGSGIDKGLYRYGDSTISVIGTTLSVLANNLEDLQEIYLRLRKGELHPVERWDLVTSD